MIQYATNICDIYNGCFITRTFLNIVKFVIRVIMSTLSQIIAFRIDEDLAEVFAALPEEVNLSGLCRKLLRKHFGLPDKPVKPAKTSGDDKRGQ